MTQRAINGKPLLHLTAVYAYRDPEDVAHVFDLQKILMDGGTDCGVVSISQNDEIGRLELIEHAVSAAQGEFSEWDRVRLIDEILSTSTPTVKWYNSHVLTLWDSPEMAIAIPVDHHLTLFPEIREIAAAHYGDNPIAIQSAVSKITGVLACHTETDPEIFGEAMETLCCKLSIPQDEVTPLGDYLISLRLMDTSSRQSLMKSIAMLYTTGEPHRMSLEVNADEEPAHV